MAPPLVVAAAQASALIACILWHVIACLVTLPLVLFHLVWPGARNQPAGKASGGVVFYEGVVLHARRLPKANAFQYNVRVALIELDDPPLWFNTQRADHMSADGARQFAGTAGRVKLLTNPAVFGYVQNPISVYYCYDENAVLDKCIAEVTNTPWGERVTFVFRPAGEAVKKALHVSPLMDMDNTWLLEAPDPGERLKLVVDVQHPLLGRYFDARLVGRRSSAPNRRNEEAGLATLLRYGWQPHRMAILIYWQAVRLIRLGVAVHGPPGPAFHAAVERTAQHPPCCMAGRVGAAAAGAAGQTPVHHMWRPGSYWPWNA